MGLISTLKWKAGKAVAKGELLKSPNGSFTTWRTNSAKWKRERSNGSGVPKRGAAHAKPADLFPCLEGDDDFSEITA